MNYNSIGELVGNTPLLSLNGLKAKLGFSTNILGKLEFFNPAGSIKDRVALKMILDAENSGRINKNSILVEPTSGNTGIGIAAIGVSRGYNVKIVMPNTMSAERINLIKAFGAEVVLTNGELGMKGAIEKAKEIVKENPAAVIMGQFENPSNPVAHYETTGPELWVDTNGKIDYLISAVGTGGTISGAGAYLKEQNPNIKVIAVEPETSAVLSGKSAGAHKIQGIGAGFVPETLNLNVIDDIITVSNEEAYNFGRMVAKTDGVLVGISSGAALAAAVKLANKQNLSGKNIVVILPDTGSRYLSTPDYF